MPNLHKKADPLYLARVSRALFVSCGLLALFGSFLLYRFGEPTLDFVSKDESFAFAGMLCVVLAICSFIAALVLRFQAAAGMIGRNAPGPLPPTTKRYRSRTANILRALCAVIIFMAVIPYVLRLSFGIPLFRVDLQYRNAVAVQLENKDFTGCVIRPDSWRHVVCRGTGFDSVLEFLMRVRGR